ncbi:MAG: hypothetical protein J5658_10520 [Prevotella sp.]|nr:hypothetical protein [Prevotella sp.]
MDKLITQIKEEWSDIASHKMKKFIIMVALAVVISFIGALLHSNIVIFIGIAILLWEGYYIRNAQFEFESIMEGISAILIFLAAFGLIIGIIKI